jgi:hypothetical protein
VPDTSGPITGFQEIVPGVPGRARAGACYGGAGLGRTTGSRRLRLLDSQLYPKVNGAPEKAATGSFRNGATGPPAALVPPRRLPRGASVRVP